MLGNSITTAVESKNPLFVIMFLRTILFFTTILCTLPNRSEAQTFSDAPGAMQGARQTLPMIRVEGNRFVDPEGNIVVFRGVAFSDPIHLNRIGQWNRSYFEAARKWNANIVRIPVHPAWWLEAGAETYFALIDDGVRWAGELGMYVIIDWHGIGNPLNGIPHRAIYKHTREDTYQFWYLITNRYRGNHTVPFFELWNEPTNRNGMMGAMPWSQYKAFMEDLIFMIRSIDSSKIPMVAGFDWGYDLSYVREDPIKYPGIAYVTHPYPQKRNPPWEEQWERDWGFVAKHYPVMATEFGFMDASGPGAHVPVIADEVYGEAIIKFFEERGISWTAWVFDPEWSPQLIEDWDFTPTRQGRFFREKMGVNP
jgi:endoglucanase